MAHGNDAIGEYIRQVRESTQRYAKDLLRENEKLLCMAVAVHSEKLQLQDQVDALRSQIQRHREIERSLMAQMSDLEDARSNLSSRYVQVEQSNSNLANLYVASYRIHGSLDRTQVIDSIHEVLVGLVGSEQFAIFTRPLGDLQAPFVVTSSMGLSREFCDALRTDAGRIGEALHQGITFVRASQDLEPVTAGEELLTACVPLLVGEGIHGAIAVFRLLSHKPDFEPIDRELFDLLATHAASALYCSELHARVRFWEAAQ
jgi:hypothetical protein